MQDLIKQKALAQTLPQSRKAIKVRRLDLAPSSDKLPERLPTVPLPQLQQHHIAISITWILGDHEMKHWRIVVEDLIASHRRLRAPKSRGPRRVELSCDPLEERVTPSHLGAMEHLAAAAHVHHQVAHHSSGATSTLPITAPPSTSPILLPSGWLGHTPPPGTTPLPHSGHGHSTNSALQTALKTLQSEVQTIELASNTTVGELTAIKVAFRTLASDGLAPSSYSALQTFENSLVTTNANATTPGSLTGNATLLAQFEALYTSSPTTQQTTDLTTAYNALAAAVTSSNITSTDIATINTDWSAVLTAANSTSTATYPYISLVTGQGAGVCIGPMAL